MEPNQNISRSFDFLRIFLFIPIAWTAYNISANLIADLSTKEFITTIGPNTWRYGFDIVQFIVFVLIGYLVAPRTVRFIAGILTVICYGIAAFWSIRILPMIIELSIENSIVRNILNYSVIVIPMVISMAITLYKYRKTTENPFPLKNST
jgi:hypothetical protein